MAGGSGGGSSNNQDFELNLASIIDCFTVLITYMLVSASFLSLGILSVTVASVNEEHTSETPVESPQKVQLSVLVKDDHTVYVKVDSDNPSENTTITINPKKNEQNQNEPDFNQITMVLNEMKSRYLLTSVLVSLDDNIIYGRVVDYLQQIKEVLSQVALSAEGLSS
jgi:biopolymer transport protein ExbD